MRRLSCSFHILLILVFLGLSVQLSSMSFDDELFAHQNLNETVERDTVIAPLSPKGLLPMDDRVTKGTLDNGMVYFIQKNVRPENRAELRLVVNAGSILEDEDQRGLAHFVEHMAFNGTVNFKKSELVDYLESVGSRFGPDLNAYTSFDETVYMLQVRTDSTELFDTGLQILRDWADGITFEDEEIDKERGVVVSEWRGRLSPEQRMQQQYLPKIYFNSRYAERLPIGDPEIIESAPYETVKRFYKDWYRPDLIGVVVVGDINVSEVEKQVVELFRTMSHEGGARTRREYEVPGHRETLVSITSDEEAPFTTVQLMYKHDKKEYRTHEDFRNGLIRSVYNGMLGARLSEITKRPDPPFLFAYSGYGSNVGDLDTYTSYAFVPEGKALNALDVLIQENRRVLEFGFTQTEMERHFKRMMDRAEKSVKEMDKTESRTLASKLVSHYLDGGAVMGPGQSFELLKMVLPGIELGEVNALAEEWITEENRVIVITGPQKDELPLATEEEVFRTVDSAESISLEPYRDEVSDKIFFNHNPELSEVVSEVSYEDVGIEYLELENGVEVYLKKTDFKNDEIIMSAISPGGSSLYSDDDYMAASSATRIVMEAGLGVYSSIEMNKWLAGKNVRVNPYIGSISEGMSGSCSPEDLQTLMQMIYLYFQAPRQDEEAFTSFISKQEALYKNLMSNPEYYLSDYIIRYKFDNHPRVGFPAGEEWGEIDYERAMAIYQDRFADASDFTFAFVGNFELDTLRQFAKRYLGNLPSIRRSEDYRDIGMRVVEGHHEERFKRGQAPKSQVELFFHGDYEWSRENNYRMQSMLSYLRIKLREELREDQGGVYGVNVFGGGSKDPYERYSITISFNTDPERTDELIQAAKKVIQQSMEELPGSLDMTKVIESQRQSRIKGLKENRFWQSQILDQHDNEKEFSKISLESLEMAISQLLPQDLQDAAGQYFDYDNFIQVVMDPEPEVTN